MICCMACAQQLYTCSYEVGGFLDVSESHYTLTFVHVKCRETGGETFSGPHFELGERVL